MSDDEIEFVIEDTDNTADNKVVQFEDITAEGLPYSENSERGVIATCLNSPEYFPECSERLTAWHFYRKAHRIIWASLRHIHRESGSIDEIQLFEFLLSANMIPTFQKLADHGKTLMETIGGPKVLEDVQNAVDYVVDRTRLKVWVDRIHHAYVCRSGVSILQTGIERIKQGDEPLSVFADSRWNLEYLSQQRHDDNARPITKFKIPPADDDSILLGKNRYLCRGGQLIIAGPSSMGKSSMAVQMAICFALGRDFLGIECKRPLKCLIVQAEDDEGDIAEVWECIRASMELGAEDIAQLERNVIIIPDKSHIGDEFIKYLETYIRRHKPDLVFLNPLLSYVGGDLSKQDVASQFLRGGLNRINKNDEWGYVIIHHTTKPSKDKSTKWQDQMYNMAGAAELVNWARAIMIVQPLEEEGHFILNLAKRGRRAGVIEQEEGKPFAKLITKIPAKHATGTVEINGRHMPRIEWQLSERSKQLRDEQSQAPKDSQRPGGREQSVKWEDVAPYVPQGFAAAKKLADIQRNMIADGVITQQQRRTVYRRIKDAEGLGLVSVRDDLKYYKK